MIEKQKFNIGDTVYFAKFDRVKTKEICKDCQGKLYLTVIMGDNSKVTIDCSGCSAGYEPPKGYNIIYEYKANVTLTTISKIEIDENGINYYTNIGYGKDRVFATKEEAEEKANELGRDYYAEQQKQLSHKYKNYKNWSWNAHYHRKEIREAKKRIEYHTSKLEVAKVKAK